MSYRQPAFMVEHPVSDLALANLDDSGTITDDDKRKLIDFRIGDLPSSIDARIDVDFGGTPAVSVNRLVIPPGHNCNGLDLRVFADATFAPTTKVSALPDAQVTNGAVIDLDCSTAAGTERYWRFIPASIGTDLEVGEFWLGEYQQLASAPVTPDFDSAYVYEQTEVGYPGGSATVELAPPRRSFELTVRNLDPAGADYAVLESVIVQGRSNPFWYWPPDTETPGPYLVKLSRDPKRTQDSSAPAVRVRYRVDLEMEEVAL